MQTVVTGKARAEADNETLRQQHQQLDEEHFDLKEKLKRVEADLGGRVQQCNQLEQEMQDANSGSGELRDKLREAGRKLTVQLNEAAQARQQLETEKSVERRELIAEQAKQREAMAQTQHEMQMDLDAQLAALQQQLQESKLQVDEASVKVVQLQTELESNGHSMEDLEKQMVAHKETAAGRAFQSQVHLMMSRKYMSDKSETEGEITRLIDDKHALGEQLNATAEGAQAQHGQMSELVLKYEASLADKQAVQAQLDQALEQLREESSKGRTQSSCCNELERTKIMLQHELQASLNSTTVHMADGAVQQCI